jgi:tetratricopeptide (TPR) repeat protein
MRQLIVLFFSVLTLGANSQDLNSALKLVASEQYENAEQTFKALLKSEPNNGDIYYYYGQSIIVYYLSDTFSNPLIAMANKAEQIFRQGIQQDPNNQINNVGLGAVTLLRSSDTTEADKYFNLVDASIPTKKKMLTPKHALILTKLGVSQLLGKVNRYDKALRYLLRAKEIDPTNASIYIALGDLYIRKNDGTNALASYNAALRYDPKSPLPKIKIGDIYMRVPNLPAARPYFDEAREIDSTFAPVYRELGELYTMAGRYDLAKINFSKFLELSGDNVPAKVQYAKALFKSKDYTTTLQILDEVLAVDKSRNYLNRLAAYSCYEKRPPELEKGKGYIEEFFKNTNAESIIPRDYIYYGRILYKMAKNDSVMLAQAFDKFNKAYAMDTSDLSLISEIALDYYNAHLYKNAILWLNRKNEKGKTDKDDLMLIGKSYYQLAQYTKADSVFGKITEKQPDNIQAYLYRARSFASMDPTSELGLAKPKFEQMINKIGSDSVKYGKELQEAITYMGYYNLQKKDYQDSKYWYIRLYNLDVNNKAWQIQSLKSRALIAYREKNYVEARDLYKKIKELDPSDPDADKAIQDLTKAINAQKPIQ